ncbi:hypothetical protein CYY_003015 [Polysphondylium violaceum]|uniref:FNIP repeat-containing protein n=1 Tax=Polysphondylium violaceum TaxID=133409 RepID=A0A8J4Q7B2_9MYCE|nr:hypothetical protein CYY_003015 [Polysphondylium violaceum]
MDSLFYTLWRNKYLNDRIRLNRFENQKISIDYSYLEANYRHLLTLYTTINNKNNGDRDCNISIELNCSAFDHFALFVKFEHRYLINCLYLITNRTDVNLFHSDALLHITKLTLELNNFENVIFDIPEQVTDLTIRGCYFFKGIINFPSGLKRLDVVNYPVNLNTLPNGLTSLSVRERTLTLPKLFPPSLCTLSLYWKTYQCHHPACQLPDSLTDLRMKFEVHDLPTFNVPYTGKDFPNAILKITDPGQLEHLELYPWVSAIQIDYSSNSFWDQKLDYKQIKTIYGSPEPLIPGVLPPQLESFTSSFYNESLTSGLFSKHLKSLQLGVFDSPLAAGVLPNTLTNLQLFNFAQVIDQPDIIPNSVTKLTLKDITLVSPGALPSSITDLYLTSLTMFPTIINVIPNRVKTFGFNIASFNLMKGLSSPVQLPSSITDLRISLLTLGSIKPFLRLPTSLKSLDLYNIEIEKNLIPNGCVYLSTNKPISDNALPPSLTHLKLDLHYAHSEVINIPPSVDLLIVSLKNLDVNRDVVVKQNGILSLMKKHIMEMKETNIDRDIYIREPFLKKNLYNLKQTFFAGWGGFLAMLKRIFVSFSPSNKI